MSIKMMAIEAAYLNVLDELFGRGITICLWLVVCCLVSFCILVSLIVGRPKFSGMNLWLPCVKVM